MPARGKSAIVGFAEYPPLRDPGDVTLNHILMNVTAGALADAGLKLHDIDGLLAGTPVAAQGFMWPSLAASILHLNPTYLDNCDIGGAAAGGMVTRAAAAIQAGLCNTVLCVTSDVVNTATFHNATRGRHVERAPLEAVYGWAGANAHYALLAQRHFYEYGTTNRHLAKIAVDQRTNACQNPTALFGDRPLTIQEVLDSPLICDPLHRYDCVRPCTGGAAFIVTTVERARSLRKPPVYVLGYGESFVSHDMHAREQLTTTSVAVSAPKAIQIAGVSPRDIKVAELYDCFTITVLVAIEDAGFCKKGEGGPFVATHDLTFKGDFPVNTHGGQLSFGQPGLAGGMSQVVEAVRQVRHEAGGRQVKDCDLAYVQCSGGSALSNSVSLVLADRL